MLLSQRTLRDLLDHQSPPAEQPRPCSRDPDLALPILGQSMNAHPAIEVRITYRLSNPVNNCDHVANLDNILKPQLACRQYVPDRHRYLQQR